MVQCNFNTVDFRVCQILVNYETCILSSKGLFDSNTGTCEHWFEYCGRERIWGALSASELVMHYKIRLTPHCFFKLKKLSLLLLLGMNLFSRINAHWINAHWINAIEWFVFLTSTLTPAYMCLVWNFCSFACFLHFCMF